MLFYSTPYAFIKLFTINGVTDKSVKQTNKGLERGFVKDRLNSVQISGLLLFAVLFAVVLVVVACLNSLLGSR